MQPLGAKLKLPGIQNTVSLGIASIEVVVPCGRELTSRQVLEKLFLGKGLIFICTYFLLALLESFVTSITNYLGGRGFHIRYSGLLLNLRVIRGFLGYASPEGRANSASMRQMVVMLTLSGLILTSWFNAAFSTLFTKHLDYQHIETFEQLAESKLSVLMDWSIRYHIENSNKNIPHTLFMPPRAQIDAIFSLNSSFAYITFSYIWSAVYQMQEIVERRILCKANAIDLDNRFPVGTIVQTNSVFGPSLDRFILNAQSSGLEMHWKRKTFEDILYNSAHIMKSRVEESNNNWELWKLQWKLLFIGLGSSLIVFIGELVVYYWQKFRLTPAF
ncbi:uncharacterized protein LOC132788816 [Drosophila nasuta]|uniref:uncharacterized protein LOC132788816 n=1 Tax=Drosophila nasuta TaxID=42062 RepID=UPI00295F286A|nr:uncharacterized protein LOC132788816 [Drosophila nasuta]